MFIYSCVRICWEKKLCEQFLARLDTRMSVYKGIPPGPMLTL